MPVNAPPETGPKETRSLLVELKPSEIAAFAMDLARNVAKTNEEEDRKKSVNSAFKDRLDRLALETRALARKVETGQDFREIECLWSFDSAKGTATLTRTDTGEVIAERKMSADELQAKLPLGKKQKAS